jgi:LysM repeat protein
VAAAGWWFWPRGETRAAAQANVTASEATSADTGDASAAIPEAVLSAQRPDNEVLTPVGPPEPMAGAGEPAGEAPTGEADSPSEPEPTPVAAGDDDRQAAGPGEAAAQHSDNPRINASLQRYEAGEVIAARQELNGMLAISRDPAEQAELRRHLERIADATIFSKEQRADEPLTEIYVVQPGDVLVNIGKQFEVPHEAIMMINGISERIHPNQRLKVPRGPFHAKIHKSKFRLDVYLQDLYLRSFPIAIGADQDTPEGKWRVKNRLTNPTYYPPPSATKKRIIPPDDPTNPLGERWIGLLGIEGDALGHNGYGIHGTIEPDSIGKAVSLGCVRMHNKDVEFVYKLMLPGHSTVTILP